MMRIRMLKPVRHIGDHWNLEKDKEYEIDSGDGNALVKEGYAELVDFKPTQKSETRTELPSPTPQKTETLTALNRLHGLVGNDLVEVFGDFGTGKSRLVGHIALEAQANGKNVLYLDNENSLPEKVRGKLQNYKYTGINLDNIISMIAGMKDGYDLVCLDSIGFPVLIDYVRLSLREQLKAIQKMILLRGYLKDYAIRNKGMAIATNQPVSEYSIAELPKHEKENAILEPFGGKGAFISKLLLRTETMQRGETTRIAVRTFKARDLPFDKQIAEFVITSDKTELRWL